MRVQRLVRMHADMMEASIGPSWEIRNFSDANEVDLLSLFPELHKKLASI